MRKAALQMAVPLLLCVMVFNAYLAIRPFRRIQNQVALSLGSSAVQRNIARVLQDLTDMETGQRGYLLTEDGAYLQPYSEAKTRIANDLSALRAGVANRGKRERSVESELEPLIASKQAEMERTISLRQQGYRHRAFKMVATNEGRDSMEQARGLLSSLSAMESLNFDEFEKQRNASEAKALSETIFANLGVLLFAVCVLALIRYHMRGLEREAAASKELLGGRDLRLEKFTSMLSNEAGTEIRVIEENAQSLLQKYEGFLPRQGCEFAEQIKQSAAELERLRRDLIDEAPGRNVEGKAA